MPISQEKLDSKREKLDKLKEYTINISALKKVNIDTLKSSANSYLEDKWKNMVQNQLIERKRISQSEFSAASASNELYWMNPTQIHTIRSSKKALDKIDKDYPDHGIEEIITAARSIITEAEPYAQVIADLKDRLEAESKLPKEPKDPIKQLPFPAQKSIRAIEEKLRGSAENLRSKLIEASANHRQQSLEVFLAKPEKERRGLSKIKDPGYQTYLAEMLEWDNNVLVAKENVDKVILDLAAISAQKTIDHYIAKHSLKLASIIEHMPNIKSIDIHARESGGLLQGSASLAFDDGRSFRVNSQIVFSFSVNGKPFYRYPTTFHDVKDANGSTVGLMVSEEDMIAWAKKSIDNNYQSNSIHP